jgi:hypothetical protein
MFSNVLTVSAAGYKLQEEDVNKAYVSPYYDSKGNLKNTSKIRVEVDDETSFRVKFRDGDKIDNLKSSKSKNPEVVQTYSKNDGDYDSYAIITVHGNKAGTYTVSFDVVKSDGSKRGSFKVKVQVVSNSGVIKKATFGKQTVKSSTTKVKSGTITTTDVESYKVKGKSGKLKLTANSQYKIKSIVVVSVNKNGKYSYKKVKNGKSITLSKARSYTNTSATGSYTKNATKDTWIYVSYKDKFFGDTVTYSITSKRGRKEIKCVTKDGQTGETSVSYSVRPSATLTLNQY